MLTQTHLVFTRKKATYYNWQKKEPLHDLNKKQLRQITVIAPGFEKRFWKDNFAKIDYDIHNITGLLIVSNSYTDLHLVYEWQDAGKSTLPSKLQTTHLIMMWLNQSSVLLIIIKTQPFAYPSKWKW